MATSISHYCIHGNYPIACPICFSSRQAQTNGNIYQGTAGMLNMSSQGLTGLGSISRAEIISGAYVATTSTDLKQPNLKKPNLKLLLLE